MKDLDDDRIYLPVRLRISMPAKASWQIFDQDSKIGAWKSSGERYQGVIHLLGELFQNSIRNIRESGIEKGKITCNVDMVQRQIEVTDNGTGFREWENLGLERSEWTNADGGSGMGVGLKAVISNSNFFNLCTKFREGITPIPNEDHLSLIITDFYKIANDESLTLNQQQKQLKSRGGIDPISEEFHGTKVVVKFHDVIFDEFLDEFDSQDVEVLLDEFFTQTPLGLTTSLFEKKPTSSKHTFQLGVVYTDGTNPSKKTQKLGFRLQENLTAGIFTATDGIGTPHQPDTNPADEDILFYRKKGKLNPKDGLQIKVFAFCVNGKGGKGVAKQVMEDNFPNAIVNRPAGSRVFLSINGFLQKFSPKTSANAQQYMTIQDWMVTVIEVNKNVVEAGRVAILDQYDARIAKEIEDVGKRFHHFLYKEANKGATSTFTNLWISKIENQIKNNPILEYKDEISSKITKKDTVFLGHPKTEQEVIGLFVDLISKKVIKDIQFKTITQGGTYDFLLKLNNTLTTVGDETRKEIKSNFKDSMPHHLYSQYVSTTIAEAKLHASSVVPEFHSHKNAKDIKECKLIVCWDLGNLTEWQKQRYVIKKMPKNFKKRIHPNETHILQKKKNPNKEYVGIICLKDLFK